MFQKTIDALKAAEVAIQEELDALLVPPDENGQGGGFHWHAAGSGILQNAALGVAGLRSELEKREAPIAQAEADAKAAEEAAAKAEAENPTPEPEPTPAPEPAPEPPTPTEVTASA